MRVVVAASSLLAACAVAGPDPVPPPAPEPAKLQASPPVALDLAGAVRKVWAGAAVEPAPPADPATYLRRVSLDLAGRVPEPAEVRAFLADPSPAARRDLVDRLIASDAFAVRWGRVYAEWFVRPTHLRRPAFREVTEAFYRDAVRRPYDDLVRDLLTARGAVTEVPAATFLASQRPGRSVEEVAAITLDLFAGRPEYHCARCHDHPELDDVRQADLWGVAAYFTRTRVPRRMIPGKPNVLEVRDRARGELRRPEGAHAHLVEPRYLDGRSWLVDGAPRREALAEALIASPGMTEAWVERVWARLLGRPLGEAGRDVRDALVREARAGGHDLGALVRAIVLSPAYDRRASGAVARGEVDPREVFAQAAIRPLEPAVLLDVLFQVTSVEPSQPHYLPLSGREVRIEGAHRQAHQIFSPPPGEDATVAGTVSQALALINGRFTQRGALWRPGSRLQYLEDAFPDPAARLGALYLWTYGRPPRAQEVRRDLAGVAEDTVARRAWEDLFFSMLISSEFLTNH